ncbi:FkbM family methyltransferase [Alphaproteobacteria bacterium KMM 3653]|uniref:FkbM family methyltransferase n=1 Tax=Harenicola maris TaxID=2841044 RepID=A0AAP2CMR6_9RHOB|nr:FkbM family methyltransferase [Harenicola maris]
MTTRLVKSFGLPINGIVHVGANRGQEIAEYSAETENVLYVEAIPSLADDLRAKLAEMGVGFTVAQACCSNQSGEKVTFNITGGGADSSSMFEMGRHAELYPSIKVVEQIELETTTVDDLLVQYPDFGSANILVIDTQGADLLVLKGARGTIERQIDCVYVEVAEEPLTDGGCTFDEIDAFMRSMGFRCKNLNIGVMDWGNAFYVRKPTLFETRGQTSLARGKTATQSSTHGNDEANFGAALAINGVFQQAGGCRTKRSEKSWWMVDLETACTLDEAVIIDRRRVANGPFPIEVEVSLDGEDWQSVTTLNGTPKELASTSILYNVPLNCKGRYLRLRPIGNVSVNLTQVYVFGTAA